MVQYNPWQYLPTAEELPDSDDTPVDNELQNLIPNLLLASLALIWPERMDWFFGVDMGIYYIPQRYPEPLVPDSDAISQPGDITTDCRKLKSIERAEHLAAKLREMGINPDIII